MNELRDGDPPGLLSEAEFALALSTEFLTAKELDSLVRVLAAYREFDAATATRTQIAERLGDTKPVRINRLLSSCAEYIWLGLRDTEVGPMYGRLTDEQHGWSRIWACYYNRSRRSEIRPGLLLALDRLAADSDGSKGGASTWKAEPAVGADEGDVLWVERRLFRRCPRLRKDFLDSLQDRSCEVCKMTTCSVW